MDQAFIQQVEPDKGHFYSSIDADQGTPRGGCVLSLTICSRASDLCRGTAFLKLGFAGAQSVRYAPSKERNYLRRISGCSSFSVRLWRSLYLLICRLLLRQLPQPGQIHVKERFDLRFLIADVGAHPVL
jgi:hypothetical protein